MQLKYLNKIALLFGAPPEILVYTARTQRNCVRLLILADLSPSRVIPRLDRLSFRLQAKNEFMRRSVANH